MAIQLGSAHGKVTIDASGVNSGVDAAQKSMGGLQSSFEKIGSSLSGIGQTMTVGVTLPLVGIGTAAVMAASDLEESMNKVNVVFGASATEIQAWSQTAATSFGLSRQQALEAVGTFGNLFTAMGITAEPTKDMSTGLVQLAADLASFNNIPVDVALEKLRAGLVGEMEPLRMLGVNLNAASVQAKAMEMGLADSTKELTPAMLAQARYALIMEQTTTAQGDFARTSDGMANSMRIMQADLKNAAASLGVQLLPIVTKLVQALSGAVQWFSDLPEPVKKAILVFGGLAAALGPVLMVVGQVMTVVGGLAGAGGLGALAAAFAPVAAAALPVIAVIAAIVLAVIAVKEAWEHNFLGMRDALSAIGEAIGTTFNAIKEIVTAFFAFLKGDISIDEMGARMQNALAGIGEAWQNAWNAIAEWWSGLAPRLAEIGTRIMDAIREAIVGALANFLAPIMGGVDNARLAIETAFTNIGAFIDNIWTGIQTAAAAAWELIKGVITTAVEVLRTSLGVIFQLISGDFEGAWSTLQEGAANIWGAVRDTIVNVANEIAPALASAWDSVQSGAESAWGNVQNAATTAWQGIKDAISSVVASIGDGLSASWANVQTASETAWSNIQSAATTAWEGIKEAIASVVASIGDGLSASWANVQSASETAWSNIRSAATTAWNGITEAIGTIADGIGGRLSTAWDGLTGTVATIWNGIVDTISNIIGGLERIIVGILETVASAVGGAARDIIFAIAGGLGSGITEARPTADLDQLGSDVLQILRDLGTDSKSFASDVMAYIADGFWSGLEGGNAWGAFDTLYDDVLDIIYSLANDAYDAGKAVGQSVADGIYDSIGAAEDAAWALADAVAAILPGSDAERGPLSNLTARGKSLPGTLAAGMRSGEGSLLRTATSMMADLSSLLTTSGSVGMQLAGAASGAGAGATAGGAAGKAAYQPPVSQQVTLNVARVGDDVDVERLAYRVAEVLKWRQGSRG